MKSKLEEFREWIDTAQTGQVYVYHTGFLVVDRCSSGRILPNTHYIANLALEAFDAGKLHLFQRKIHDGVYEYIAMKRSPFGRNW